MAPISRPVIWARWDHPAGNITEAHTHDEAQLLYASRGVMTVETAEGIWVVPPHRAVWIPPHESHAVVASTAISMRTIRFDTARIRGLPAALSVVAVTALLRELIVTLSERPADYDTDGPDGRLISVIVDQLRSLEQMPLHLPYPASPGLQRVAELLGDDPGSTAPARAWAEVATMSGRSFARHFQTETGMTFGQWRQQARLLAALRLLAGGESIARTAEAVGYESESAFIAMFRKALGTTPGRYFNEAKTAVEAA